MQRGLKKLLMISTIILYTVFLTSNIKAQLKYSFSWFLIKDDNTFKSRNEYDELINTASFLISRGYSGESFNIQGYFNANLSLFNNYKDLKNHSHNFGISGKFLKGNYTVDFGANASIRRNDAQYIYYNTDNFDFFGRLRYEPSLSKIYTLGLTYAENKFKEFDIIDNNTYRIYAKYQRFFQSKLSISGEMGLGVKNYINQEVFNYYGQGEGFPPPPPRYSEDPISSTIFSMSAKIAKSITDNTGISFNFGGQLFVGDPIEAFSNGIYYYTENDLYDDPYSYEDKFSSLNFTRQFNVDLIGKFGIKYQRKYYKGTPALDEFGELTGANRRDTRKEYSFLISKKFNTEWSFPGAIELYFRFLIRQNTSNDIYYKFTDHLGIFGFTFSK